MIRKALLIILMFSLNDQIDSAEEVCSEGQAVYTQFAGNYFKDFPTYAGVSMDSVRSSIYNQTFANESLNGVKFGVYEKNQPKHGTGKMGVASGSGLVYYDEVHHNRRNTAPVKITLDSYACFPLSVISDFSAFCLSRKNFLPI